MTNFTVIDIETTGNLPWRDSLVAVGIGGKVYRPEEGRQMARLLLQRDVTIVCHTNYDLRWLLLDGATLGSKVRFHDTKVMAWMLDGTQELALDSLASRYLGYVPAKPIFRRQGRIMFRAADGDMPIEDVPWPEMEAYNLSDIEVEAELYTCLLTLLEERGLIEHFLTEEAPFSRLLVEMEQTGLPFDTARAADLLAENETEEQRLREALRASTGAIEFNPGSGDQVAAFLYSDLWESPVKFAIPRLVKMTKEEKLEAVRGMVPEGVEVTRIGREYGYGVQHLEGMGLRPPKVKRKQGEPPKKRPTVAAKLLNLQYGGNPWVADYVAWKKLEKLNGYLRDWLAREHDGVLYGRFDQSGTITGRLSSREPNMQQVSNSSGVRDLFRGDLIVGDYGGLEARLAAHFSQDSTMLEVFREGHDLYGVIAADVFGGPADKTNPRRNIMKYAWLSSQYGAQGETLLQAMLIAASQGKSDSGDLDVVRAFTPKQADDLVEKIKGVVPRMFEWRDEVVDEARALGFVTTIGGRYRHLADIDSAEWSKMARAERQAVNSKVQGSAADIVRRAMLECRRAIHPSVARICLQVHDEIIWRRGEAWDDREFEKLVYICEHGHGFDLIVPLTFEAEIADSWAAKGGAPGLVVEAMYEYLNEDVPATA